jgi:hypothetical protein
MNLILGFQETCPISIFSKKHCVNSSWDQLFQDLKKSGYI